LKRIRARKEEGGKRDGKGRGERAEGERVRR